MIVSITIRQSISFAPSSPSSAASDRGMSSYVRADTVIAAADDEARLLAEARLGSTPEIEVWCGSRWVARVGARTARP